MNAAPLVPELALARVVTAGGPYRPGDDLSLAFTTPTVSRLVAHDAELRSKCVPLERALVPDTIAVVITHCAAPYKSGEILTLSFVDPRVARIHESLERTTSVVPESSSEKITLDLAAGAPPDERFAQSPTAQRNSAQAAHAEDKITEPRSGRSGEPAPVLTPDQQQGTSLASPDNPTAKVPSGERFGADTPASTRRAASASSDSGRQLAVPAQIGAGEPMTLRVHARVRDDATGKSTVPDSARNDASMQEHTAPSSRSAVAGIDSIREPSPHTHPPAKERVTVRLEWKAERLRRFVQVVDKLFTIDRLGWYRHSLAMRLLIPDEVACGDTLANIEAMRHLQALRAAAVESLGKPLLAACMPGFSISSEWLDSIESAREARAIAGLRDALLPYADDSEEASDKPSGDALHTTGTISRTGLLAENATSVEAFLPLLIPTTAHDAALGVRLAEYRRLLIELFAQTARAGEPVRLQQMAQPNHSLDDRLWQLVGAAAEAFGGFAHA